jgi:hypothetical protein
MDEYREFVPALHRRKMSRKLGISHFNVLVGFLLTSGELWQ